MPRLYVSDHAILRFAERALDFNPAPIESLIHAAVGDAKNGLFKLPGHELAARVKNGVVVTVTPIVPRRISKPKKPKAARPVKEPMLVRPDGRLNLGAIMDAEMVS